MHVRRRFHLQIGEYDWQTLMGAVRFFVFGAFIIIGFGWFGSTQLDGLNVGELADQYHRSIWILSHLPRWVMVIIASIFNWSSIRYMIAPFSAIVFVIIMGAYFVQDVYALPQFSQALNYVLASMFGINYPALIIEKGVKQVSKGEVNLIDKIGGPGFVVIEPGNAAMFKKLRGPSTAKVSETHFLEPFETIASTINLDEQQGTKEAMSAMTRDGIKVAISDVQFRYRVKQMEEKEGVPMRRSLSLPYPFSETAIHDMTFNLMVQQDGLETWRSAVERSVTGTIADFVSSHTVDYLTAPRTNDYKPRLELRNQFFVEEIRRRLSGLGAELLWIDVGHLAIDDESVDDLRTNLWSADWAGDAADVRSYGESVRQAYQELGRAEVQADLIMSIAAALREAGISDQNGPDNVRKILLARTAQLLSAVHDKSKQRESNGK